MSEIDLDLLAALLGVEPHPDLMRRYENESEVRALYDDVAGLGQSLDQEGARRRDLIRDALSAGPAPGEERIPELLADRIASDRPGSGAKRWPRAAVWAPLAAAAALLLLIRPWAGPDSELPPGSGLPGEPGPVVVPTLGPDDGDFRLLDASGGDAHHGELRWTPVEGEQVYYEVWVWEADEAGVALDELFPLLEIKDLSEPRWTPAPTTELPASILVQVHAFVAGELWDSTPSVWLQSP